MPISIIDESVTPNSAFMRFAVEQYSSLTGCVVNARLLGVLEAEQTEKGKTVRNDRLLAVAVASRQYSDLHSVKAMSASLQSELEHFFLSYNQIDDRLFKPLG